MIMKNVVKLVEWIVRLCCVIAFLVILSNTVIQEESATTRFTTISKHGRAFIEFKIHVLNILESHSSTFRFSNILKTQNNNECLQLPQFELSTPNCSATNINHKQQILEFINAYLYLIVYLTLRNTHILFTCFNYNIKISFCSNCRCVIKFYDLAVNTTQTPILYCVALTKILQIYFG